jgi:membrane protease subunit (stomatin/prohibitin family)
MAIIDRVKYDGPAGVLVWRHPPDDLTWGTQVIVNQSQEALFYKGGQALDLLGPGTHTLETSNIPLLRGLIKLPFGGKTPFAAEIYFINKTANLDVKWGTTAPMQLLDPKYGVALPVRAFGQLGVKVADSRKLVVQLAGTMGEFTVQTLSDYFRGVLQTRVKDYVAEVIVKQKIHLLEISAHLEEISAELTQKLSKDFAAWGLQLVNFYLNSIDVPEDDESVRRLKKILADKAEMDILGDQYRVKRTFDAMQAAASNEGSAGAGVGMGMGLGAGAGMGQMMAGMMGGAAPGQPAAAQATAACPKCSAQVPAGAKFCPGCGSAVGPRACAKCSAQTPAGSKFCSACGSPLG